MKKTFLVDEKGFYGDFGGSYVPEILYATVEKLREQYLPILESKEFQDEYMSLLRDYVGRPSPLYFAHWRPQNQQHHRANSTCQEDG